MILLNMSIWKIATWIIPSFITSQLLYFLYILNKLLLDLKEFVMSVLQSLWQIDDGPSYALGLEKLICKSLFLINYALSPWQVGGPSHQDKGGQHGCFLIQLLSQLHANHIEPFKNIRSIRFFNLFTPYSPSAFACWLPYKFFFRFSVPWHCLCVPFNSTELITARYSSLFSRGMTVAALLTAVSFGGPGLHPAPL